MIGRQSTLYFLWIAALFALARGQPSAIDDQLQRQKSELKELEEKLRIEKSALDSLGKKKTNVAQEVEQIQETVRLNREYLVKMDSISSTINLSLKEVEKNLNRIQKKIESNNLMMGRRVRALYMADRRHWTLLLSPRGETNFFTRIFFMRRLLEYDNALIATARKNRALEMQAEQRLQEKLVENLEFKRKKNEETLSLNKEREKLNADISALRKDESRRQEALKKMEENTKTLLAIIQKLELQRKKEKQKTGAVKKLDDKGKFCFPSPGEVVSKFGLQYHATLKTKTKNLGVEFMSPPGKAVLSAAPGEVVYVNDIPGYGRGVILYNGSGYYTIYGNLSDIRVREGEKIKGCQELAAVPSSASRVSRKIYFEVRKERNSVDPVKWLKSMID